MSDPLHAIGKFLLVFGIVLVFLGVIVLLLRHTGIHMPGKLPGDIVIQKKNFTFYFPVTTSIIISIVLSIILYLIFGRK
ncbi:MAG: DUF2905 family protein [Deltaproteobacteria bacterium]|nr:DUF2905 family protein [Deltaproteobacteria bacterium]